MSVQPQATIGEYRVDFLVRWVETYDAATWAQWLKEARFDQEIVEGVMLSPAEVEVRVVVECDGHQHHEKTKHQAKRDKQRDRLLQRLGYPVFRFTGSEIWQDAIGCAEDAIGLVEDEALGRAHDISPFDVWM